jgi:hypothetical protein
MPSDDPLRQISILIARNKGDALAAQILARVALSYIATHDANPPATIKALRMGALQGVKDIKFGDTGVSGLQSSSELNDLTIEKAKQQISEFFDWLERT